MAWCWEVQLETDCMQDLEVDLAISAIIFLAISSCKYFLRSEKSPIGPKHLLLRNKAFLASTSYNKFLSAFCFLSVVFYIRNVLNLLCFLNKSTFIKCTKKVFVKKGKSGQKVLSGPVKYISVDPKEAFIDIY